MDEIDFLLKITKRAEFFGFKIKDKLYIDKNNYYGNIFRFFSLKDSNDFFDDSKKHRYSNCFINAYKSIKKGRCSGKVIDGQIYWDD